MLNKEKTRKKVKHYKGYQINPLVLGKVNIIDLTRIKENITMFSMERVKTLKQLTRNYLSEPNNTHIILGEDWYIAYTISEDELDIKDWIAINTVENKFAQTTEMFNALKKILLENAHCNIKCILRHSTSYKFYKKLLDEGLIEEQLDIVEFDDDSPKLEEIKYQILDKYDSLEEYLSDESREKYEEYHIDDFIYHEVDFNVTKSFTNRYKNRGR